jgi:hypothetical protein
VHSVNIIARRFADPDRVGAKQSLFGSKSEGFPLCPVGVVAPFLGTEGRLLVLTLTLDPGMVVSLCDRFGQASDLAKH